MMTPSDRTIELRLARLIEGAFMDAETEADLRQLGISPDAFRQLCRDRIEAMVEPVAVTVVLPR